MTQYTVVDTSDRDEWLAARENVLTATDIARLYCGGPAAWRDVRQEKNGVRSDFDSQYMRWGREREGTISDYVRMFVDSTLEPNDQLLISKSDPRIGATPDMIGQDVVGELKTTKNPLPDMSAGLQLKNTALRYYIQVQVQVLVTGADACVFAWEQHDDDWDTGPHPLGIRDEIIRPDKAAFKTIRDIVDRFYEGDSPGTEVVAKHLDALRRLDTEKKEIEVREREIRDALRDLVGTGNKIVTAHGAVTVTAPTVRKSFNSKAFQAERPDDYERYLVEKEIAPSMRITFAKDDE